MSNYATPGVYVEENSTLPPSIVQVSTAVPVFLGYTQKGPLKEAVRITSLKEYESTFGFGTMYPFETVKDVDGNFSCMPPEFKFFFYEAMRLYFMNGGGACYIISVGSNVTFDPSAASPILVSDYTHVDAVHAIDKLDEPTLIAFPEAIALGKSEYKDLVDAATNICFNTMDKFTLIDCPTIYNLTNTTNLADYREVIGNRPSYSAAYYPQLNSSLKVAYDKDKIQIDGSIIVLDKQNADHQAALGAIAAVSNVTVSPSALMAGVYAKTDRDLGVWKAPANLALQGVINPVTAISDANQALLNVDATSGKSINAIREFAGKGTVVWGARTVDGNSNEWRYINVRRLFITVEESVKKATSQFVFENNDAKTWVKVSSMIKSYLNGLWKDGALTGASPEEAYFVNVGLGVTMSQQDVLEGRMIVKIGLAAVRPAEFIILEFSHFVNQ